MTDILGGLSTDQVVELRRELDAMARSMDRQVAERPHLKDWAEGMAQGYRDAVVALERLAREGQA